MDDEKLLFEHAMKGVKPLSKKYQNKLSLQAKDPYLSPGSQNTPQYQSSLIQQSHDHEAVCVESNLSHQNTMVTRRQFSRLKQGKIAYQSSLDLHQKTCLEAEKSIKQFIHANYEAHHKCCLIIHGKGQGLLKSVTEKVLKNMALVLAFHSAKPIHGGAGAVYVLLKS